MHYIFNREGAARALGLRNIKELNRYIKKAKNANVEPSKKLGNTEYFDVDLLLHFVKKNRREGCLLRA